MGGSAISKEKRNPPQSKIMPKYVKLSAKHPNDSTPKVPRGITIEQIKKDYDRYREHWRRSKCRQDLLDILCQILATRHFKITNCVCIGLGSFTNGVYTSMWQLAMIQTVLNLLQEKYKLDAVYFQDPLFNKMDKAFLTYLNATVLERPEAEAKVTSGTFLFAPRLEPHALSSILHRSSPALCIGTSSKYILDHSKSDYTEGDISQLHSPILKYNALTEVKPMPSWSNGMDWCEFMEIRCVKPQSSHLQNAKSTSEVILKTGPS